MKKLILLAVFSFAVTSNLAYSKGFTLQSTDIQGQLSNEQVFNSFGCSGKNISPKLTWKNTPKETKSIALTMYDPDAPTGSGWWHWVIFDIPANIKSLDTNAGNLSNSIAPKNSIQSATSYGKAGFGGACPPQGDKPHQYIFTVYALKVSKLGLDENASPALVGYYLNANMLAKSSVVAYYQR
ncbi:MAG: YbhB/YbcL family Raf kinase inhibitor-like protein [Methylococcales symbiont of Hymedesmia sp. n. MRB-2018]|nr:MAG: YbhB/YbcL family Raf kinase inhibitor-like protein [Methylococcales symbiont of Hymedesmia sp. n. MRB-2018]KAF3984743.1 MAG: YbhB/YbcL family Raf kinase inhibitor-like protein [Methylococcales symbiont of Hymedesmia sp. n. MRB-2018]